MAGLGIKEPGIDEKFVRSGGAGGQNVNKVATCVMLHHNRTGIQVKCQMTRSQGDNRYHARKILCERLEERILGRKSAAARKRHKIRQQKRKRSKRAKEKMRRTKELRKRKKELRKIPERD